jgi:hypothetical protein
MEHGSRDGLAPWNGRAISVHDWHMSGVCHDDSHAREKQGEPWHGPLGKTLCQGCFPRAGPQYHPLCSTMFP